MGILSDVLILDKSSQSIITLPVTPLSDADKNYRYVGDVADFDSTWREPLIPKELLFKTLTGRELCPVSNGEVSFHAITPIAGTSLVFTIVFHLRQPFRRI